SGLTLGSIYALTALGYVIIFRSTAVVNFAQGEMMMVGAVLALVLHKDFGLGYVAAFSLALAGAWVLGVVMERLAYRPLVGAPIFGVSVPRVFSVSWGLAAALAAAAGILLAPLIIITPDMGVIGIKGFIAAILGGFNSLPGAVVGGILLGILENLAGVYVSSA